MRYGRGERERPQRTDRHTVGGPVDASSYGPVRAPWAIS